jgi:flagellar biogenesis protein FliO
MSLKVFHYIFVAASILLAIGFGIWALMQFASEGGQQYLIFAAGSGVSIVALVFYGKYVLKKLKHLPYL